MNIEAIRNLTKKQKVIILSFVACASAFWMCAGAGVYWAVTRQGPVKEKEPAAKVVEKAKVNKKMPTKPREEWLWHDFQDYLINMGERLHHAPSPGHPGSEWFGPDPVIPTVLDMGADAGYFLVKKEIDEATAEQAVNGHKAAGQYVFSWGPFFFYRGEEKTLRHYKELLEK